MAEEKDQEQAERQQEIDNANTLDTVPRMAGEAAVTANIERANDRALDRATEDGKSPEEAVASNYALRREQAEKAERAALGAGDVEETFSAQERSIEQRAIDAGIGRVDHFGHRCEAYYGPAPMTEFTLKGEKAKCPSCQTELDGHNSRTLPLIGFTPTRGELYKDKDGQFRTIQIEARGWGDVVGLVPDETNPQMRAARRKAAGLSAEKAA